MRRTLELDEGLLAKARALTGLRRNSALVEAALRALIERETARRLARLGGSEPDFGAPPRRRSRVVAHLRGRGDVALSTDAIMTLTRDETPE